jgi:hypothetical protein
MPLRGEPSPASQRKWEPSCWRGHQERHGADLFFFVETRVETSDDWWSLVFLVLAYIDWSHEQISLARSIPVFFFLNLSFRSWWYIYIYVPSACLIHQSRNQIFMVHKPYIFRCIDCLLICHKKIDPHRYWSYWRQDFRGSFTDTYPDTSRII